MSLDGAFLHIVKTEMFGAGLINSRVEKIHQPSREEIIISLHRRAVGDSIASGGGSVKLLISANPASARACLTSHSTENPSVPPMFCQLLRKRLGGGRLTEITQDGLERIVYFKFLCRNEIGDEEKYILSVEIMGRSSNIVLLLEKNGELRVVDAMKRVTDEISSARRVLPGLIYELPPKAERLSILDFTDFTKARFLSALNEHTHDRLDKALIKIFEGICPLFAREAAFTASGFANIPVIELNEKSTTILYDFLEKASVILKNADKNSKPTMLLSLDKKPFDFTFIDIRQYGGEMTAISYESANELLDAFYAERAKNDRVRQRAGALLKTLNNRYERVLRKIDARRSDLAACAEREKFRKWGDLVSANIYKLEKGENIFTAQDFITGEEVKIPLDERLSPQLNAQKYYAEYKKLQTAEKTLTELIKDGENELKYLDSVLEAASRAANDSDLLEIKRELIETGYYRENNSKSDEKNRKSAKKGAKQERPGEPLKFVSSDNDIILIGRNNRQNDVLTLKTAKPGEIWLHAKDIAGSHVIIRSENPSEKTLEEAARLAAWFSKGKNSSRVPVDYTRVKYVKKPAGGKPGMVIFTRNKTLYVTPDEEIYNKLKV